MLKSIRQFLGMDKVVTPMAPTMVHERIQERDKSFVLLDVREPNEFHQGHIKGATHIPLDQLSKRLDSIPEGKEIICVCKSGARANRAARQLHRAGYTVGNIKGGMLAWKRAKLPVQKGGGSGKKVRKRKRY